MKPLTTFKDLRDALQIETSIFLVVEENGINSFTRDEFKAKGANFILNNGFNGKVFLQE